MAKVNQVELKDGTLYDIEDASAFHTGTFPGIAQANPTSAAVLSTSQTRSITISDVDLTAGTSQLATGEIYMYFT